MFEYHGVKIDFTALAALVAALTTAYATVKGKAMHQAAKEAKEVQDAQNQAKGE